MSYRLHDIVPAGPGWATLEISCDHERLSFSSPGLIAQSAAASLRVPEKQAPRVLGDLDRLVPRLEGAADSLPGDLVLEVRLDASLDTVRAEASLSGPQIHLAWGDFRAEEAPGPLPQGLVDIALALVDEYEGWKVIGMPSRGREGDYLLFAQRPGATISLSCEDLDTNRQRLRRAGRVIQLVEGSSVLRFSDDTPGDEVSIRLVDQTLEARRRGLELELPTSALWDLREFAARVEWLTGPEAAHQLGDQIDALIAPLEARALERDGVIVIQLADGSGTWGLAFDTEADLRLPLEGVGDWRTYCQRIAERVRSWILARAELEAIDPLRSGWTEQTLWERIDDLPVIRATASGLVAEHQRRHERLRSAVSERLSDDD